MDWKSYFATQFHVTMEICKVLKRKSAWLMATEAISPKIFWSQIIQAFQWEKLANIFNSLNSSLLSKVFNASSYEKEMKWTRLNVTLHLFSNTFLFLLILSLYSFSDYKLYALMFCITFDQLPYDKVQLFRRKNQ